MFGYYLDILYDREGESVNEEMTDGLMLKANCSIEEYCGALPHHGFRMPSMSK
jgi:hypothetical protein